MTITESIPMVDVPMVFPDDTARVRKSDPLTSHVAADAANLTDSRAAVLSMLRKQGGLAAFELEQRLPVWSPSRIRTALTELMKADMVVRSEETRMSPYGKPAGVWVIA